MEKINLSSAYGVFANGYTDMDAVQDKNISRLQNAADFNELKDLCNELGLNACDDVVPDDDIEYLVKKAFGEDNDWQQVARLLANVNNLLSSWFRLSAYGYLEDLVPGAFEEYKADAVAEYKEQE